jgi:serine protease inhibitor
MQHNLYTPDVDRMVMERGTFFNVNTRDDNNNTYKKINNDIPNIENYGIGEITGEEFNASEIDQGMPLRSKKLDIKNRDNIDNTFTDFNLYSEKPTLEISYNDPTNNGGNSKYADINNNNKLLNDIMPEQKLSAVINLFSWNFYNLFKKNISNKQILISPYTIITNMIMFYIGANDITEENMRNFFSFPRKDELLQSILKIHNKICQLKTYKCTNIVLLPTYHTINRAFLNYISKIGILYSVNIQEDSLEKINNMIENGSKKLLWQFFKSTIIKKNTNYGERQRIVNMMYLYNRELFYFEDDLNIIVELEFCNNNNIDLVFGVILCKTLKNKIDYYLCEYYINNLKLTKIKQLCMPQFRQENKYKLEGLFKKIGLLELFTGANLSDIIMNNNKQYITDYVHHSLLVINEHGIDNTKSSIIGDKIIDINRPFIYYIRHKPYNNIICIGEYS